ncbi:MAG: ATP-binding protein [Pseudomonadales bacterium]
MSLSPLSSRRRNTGAMGLFAPVHASFRHAFAFFLFTAVSCFCSAQALNYAPHLEAPHKGFTLSDEERDWLAANGPFRFTGDPSWLPYESFDAQGRYRGIVADYLDEIQTRLGIEFEILPANTWPAAMHKMRNGDVDLISSSLRAMVEHKKTRPYLVSPIVIVMRQQQGYVDSLREIADRRVAVSEGSGYISAVRSEYPQLALAPYINIEAALTAVSTGAEEVAIVNLAQANFYIAKLGGSNLRIVGKTKFNTDLTFSVGPRLEPAIELLNRAIDSIPLKRQQEILDSWGRSKFAARTDYDLTIKVALLLSFIILLFVAWGLGLRREVVRRRAAEERLKLVLDNTPQLVVVISRSADMLMANPMARRFLGIERSAYATLQLGNFISATARARLLVLLQRHGQVERKLLKLRGCQGRESDIQCSVLPVSYANQEALLCIGVDLSERIELERRLVSAKRQAEVASRAKSDFLANMSHEIRTPMNAIIGFANLVHAGVKDPLLKRQSAIIKSAGSSLLAIINDVLDLSKIEAEKVELQLAAVDLVRLLNDCSELFRPQAQSKGLRFELDIDAQVPPLVELDEQRIRQVLFNLLSNSIKFTDRGVIQLSVSVVQRDEACVELEIAVTDSGIGVEHSQRERIFNSFDQQQGQDSHYGGSGLGLSISRRLSRLMGGDVTLDSHYTDGARFVISLPQLHYHHHQSSQREETIAAPVVFEPCRVLIVDDVEHNRQLLEALLLQFGITYESVGDGLTALQACAEQYYDVVLMDIRMPRMNGYEAAKALRQHEQRPVIIALTASVVADKYAESQRYLFDDYLAKPVDAQLLLQVLKSHLAHRELSAATATATAEAEPALMQHEDRAQLHGVLKHYGAELAELRKSNNLAAIAALQQRLAERAAQDELAALLALCTALEEALHSFDILTIQGLLTQLQDAADGTS